MTFTMILTANLQIIFELMNKVSKKSYLVHQNVSNTCEQHLE